MRFVVREEKPGTDRERAVRDAVRFLVGTPAWEAARKELPPDASTADIAWRVLNRQALDPADEGFAYFQMALVLQAEGKPHARLLKQFQAAKLRAMQPAGITRVQISAVGCCDACARLDGRELTMTDARDAGPLPPADCTATPVCRCSYDAVVDA